MKFPRSGWSTGSSSVLTPTNMVSGGSAHTKGSYQQLLASADQACVGFWISSDVAIGTTGALTGMLMDIAFGASGSEVIQVANIPFGNHGLDQNVFIPLFIPVGTEVRGRIQATVASDIYDPRILFVYGGYGGGFGGYQIADTIGVDTATSLPSTGDLTDNAFDQAIASTTRHYRALTVHACLPDNSATAADITVDLAVGASSSEQVLGTWGYSTTTAEIINRIKGPLYVECDIPSGSRLSLRKNSTADLSAAIIGWA